MKAALCSKFGAIDEVLEVSENVEKPILTEMDKGHMLIRVLACSISPGDNRSIDGSVDKFRNPKKWPWIPGHDVCGIVEQVLPDETYFKQGDCIVATSSKDLMCDGLAEYSLVETAHAAIKSESLTPEEASCLGTSGQRALQAMRQANVTSESRVLVLGASGGFGTIFTQLLKHTGAYVAGTSTQKELCASLGVDRVIDYRHEKWWQIQEFIDQPFDVIFDAESKRNTALPRTLCGSVLKPRRKGGYFMAVTMDDPDLQIHSWSNMFGLFLPVLGRLLWTTVWPFSPKYRMLAFKQRREDLNVVMKRIEEGVVKIIFDSGSPLPFTTEGVRTAFHAINNKHAHGKVCIHIQDA